MDRLNKMTSFNRKEYTDKQKQNHQEARLKFQRANLSDDILFGMVMLNDEFAKTVLGIILGKKVTKLWRRSVQESLPNLPGFKSVRLDVIIELEDGTIYNVEMQALNTDNMPKRSRFYQGLLDTITLYSGKTVKYKILPDTVVIFITEFDLFGKGRYKYTFKNECLEEAGLELGDGTTKIFLNTKGKIEDGVSPELIEFLKFVHESSEQNAHINDNLWNLYKIVQAFKGNKEKEDDYMNTLAIREEGIEEGKILGAIEMLIDLGSSSDQIITQVMNKYHLTFEEAKEYVAECLD